MTAPRAQHTATTLGDGRVLVTGGTDGAGTYQTSEVFDPVANTWTALPSLMSVSGFASARQLHTATLLPDGRVLVAGGLGVETLAGSFGALASCVLFDPSTDTFTSTGALPEERGWHVAVTLPGGQVLVAGGVNASLATSRTSATFDPASGQWTAGGASGAHTWGALVTAGPHTLLVGGGDVVHGQGYQLAGLAQPVVERYDPTARTFGAGPTNLGGRVHCAVATNSAGEALFAGGLALNGQDLSPQGTTEVYDPQRDAFLLGPTLAVARSAAEIAEIATSGDMLIVGGLGPLAATSACEVVLMKSRTNAGQVTMAEARVDHRAVTLRDGRILVSGGMDDRGRALSSCELHAR